MKKNRFKLNLAAIAFVFAVASAFAFQKPANSAMRFGKLIDAQGNISWINVSGQHQGADYECQSAQEVCTAELVNDDPNLGQPIPGTETAGRFAQ